MLTITEIRNRKKIPYAYEKPYYSNPHSLSGAVYRSYYEVHGGSWFDDITTYLRQLPEDLKLWIEKRITVALESGTIEYITDDAILAYIDVAHFFYYGRFAE